LALGEIRRHNGLNRDEDNFKEYIEIAIARSRDSVVGPLPVKLPDGIGIVQPLALAVATGGGGNNLYTSAKYVSRWWWWRRLWNHLMWQDLCTSINLCSLPIDRQTSNSILHCLGTI
jgi:hypothetical protein